MSGSTSRDAEQTVVRGSGVADGSIGFGGPKARAARIERGSVAIGSGLEPGRVARRIERGERIHVVGAAGAGASAAVLLAHWQGAVVTGCDPGGPSQYTPAIEAEGIGIAWRHDPAHVAALVEAATAAGASGPSGVSPASGATRCRLAVTKALTAVDPHNAELEAARVAGVPLEPWQQVVADAAFDRILVGVAGTHGKSTSAGWLVHVLTAAGLDPSAFVGALLPARLTGGIPSTARHGSGRTLVVEADEYAGNFDPYRPSVTVLTSAEWDHPDVFADQAAVVAAFREWLDLAALTVPVPVLVANVADAGVADVVRGLRAWPGKVVATILVEEGAPLPKATEARDLAERYATAGGRAQVVVGRILLADPDGTTIEVRPGEENEAITARLALAGRHNASNALGVAGAAGLLGVTSNLLAAGLGSFAGVGRRLERKGEACGVVVYDDYGHHPTAIRATLAAVRQLEPGRRIWAVYEPLTYHRTAAMLDQFAEVLATADAVAVADIWASRDPDTTIVSAADLAQAVARKRPGMVAAAPGSVEATAAWLGGEVRSGDVVLVMGGGKSYRIAELLVESLSR